MEKRVLLIDDDRDEHEIFKKALHEYDPTINFFSAYDGQEGLDFLSKGHANYIFLDINMPGKNGLDILRLLKKDDTLKDIPVIIYSTSDGRGFKKMSLDLGAENYFTKPTTYRGMQKLFETVLRDSSQLLNSGFMQAVKD
jgi:DNA-binding response OmpR family regulator